MKRSRFREEQIIAMLKELESGTPTSAMCRIHFISSATFYKYKARVDGFDASEVM